MNVDPKRCPLCGKPNACGAHTGTCWCREVVFPDELLKRVPEELKDKACICRECLERFTQQTNG